MPVLTLVVDACYFDKKLDFNKVLLLELMCKIAINAILRDYDYEQLFIFCTSTKLISFAVYYFTQTFLLLLVLNYHPSDLLIDWVLLRKPKIA